MLESFQIFGKIDAKRILPVALLLAALIFGAVINNQLNISGDNARYIILSKSIAQDGAYLNSMDVVTVPETHYPFFYPLVLSPLTKLFGVNFTAYRILNIVLALLGGLTIFALFRRENSSSALIVTALTLFNPLFLSYINIEMTEIIYIFLSFLTILTAGKLFSKEDEKRTVDFIPIMILLVASFYTRTIGIALVAGVLCYALMRREFKSIAIILISFALMILPWSLRTMNLGMGYAHEFMSQTVGISDIIQRIIGNFKIMFLGLTDLIYYPFFTVIKVGSSLYFVKIIADVAILVSFFCGILVRLHNKEYSDENFVVNIIKRLDIIDYYFIFYSAACLVWTVSYNRYVLPLLPYIWYNILIFIEYAFGALFKMNERSVRKICGTFLLLTLSLNLAGDAREVYKRRTNYLSPAQSSFVSAADWIKENTKYDDLIMSKAPAWIYVYTGRHGFEYIGSADPDVNKKLIDDKKPDYLVFDNMTPGGYSTKKFMSPLIEKYGNLFHIVYKSETLPETIIYKIEKM